MLKLIGAVIIMISSVSLGLLRTQKLTARVTLLKLIKNAMCDTKNLIIYSAPESEVLIENIKSGKKYAHFGKDYCNLEANDKKQLTDFFLGLGKTDTKGQIAYCDMAIHNMTESIIAAEAEAGGKARLYTALGFLGGAAVTIIII